MIAQHERRPLGAQHEGRCGGGFEGPLLLALPVAAAAGLVSFLSPCVLPLVPGYLSYVTGLTGRELEDGRPTAGVVLRDKVDVEVGGTATLTRPAPAPSPVRGRVVAGAALFVLGFTAVFVAYGSLFGSLGDNDRQHQRGIEQVFVALTILLVGVGLLMLTGTWNDLVIELPDLLPGFGETPL